MTGRTVLTWVASLAVSLSLLLSLLVDLAWSLSGDWVVTMVPAVSTEHTNQLECKTFCTDWSPGSSDLSFCV